MSKKDASDGRAAKADEISILSKMSSSVKPEVTLDPDRFNKKPIDRLKGLQHAAVDVIEKQVRENTPSAAYEILDRTGLPKSTSVTTSTEITLTASGETAVIDSLTGLAAFLGILPGIKLPIPPKPETNVTNSATEEPTKEIPDA
jgi:hypothetical protein